MSKKSTKDLKPIVISEAKTPKGNKVQKKQNTAWKNYTEEELTWWVTLLTKRAGHRKNSAMKQQDLKSAKIYARMLELKKANTAKTTTKVTTSPVVEETESETLKAADEKKEE